MSHRAVDVLAAAQRRSGGYLSVGLEPCAEYLPEGFSDTIDGHASWLRTIVASTAGLACAYKLNLAFFEALGSPGWAMLEQLRTELPSDVLLIGDAKRGDIGSSARRYAQSLFDHLDLHAATVNPLMGRDAIEPFMAHTERLTFLLALTSNPGASDFLEPEGLYRRIAQAAESWNTNGNLGLVVGATRTDMMQEVRRAAPSLPFLVPGVGAQGGSLEETIMEGRGVAAHATVLIHVTRGLFPRTDDRGEPGEVVHRKAAEYVNRMKEAGRSVSHH